ncbi:MAG: hypothetical protein ONB48_01450 [candidate division KSB1 bacterium]|nr:hypothetical protein [candidate division KSB1 bacterium]MDZ7272658.1 hypothetical protein [candidate division KSB1 bacterium]MDZ7284320.1 hypothetical protein [candidate division KSB1 bacterium]MDZ7297284.1 hypothetical protein [candidate division KSB1 bacterium]MDZ7309507.1 hypothetical protein [candidate division KSB1 bacterium]
MPIPPAAAHRLVRARHVPLPWHGLLGLAIMLAGQILMFAKVNPVWVWFTPVQWTGYLLLLDALLLKQRGESFLFAHTREFAAMAFFSVIYWFMFEGYNLHLRNWVYVNLPENLTLRLLGFVWSFATIYPGVLLTHELLQAHGLFRGAKWHGANAPPPIVPAGVLHLFVVFGFLCCTVPLLLPATVACYLFVCVWIGFIFLLDPLNYRLGAPSLLRELQQRSLTTLLTLFTAGLICGFLWEFWNYWAGAKWVYTVPYLNKPKIFEMPLYGYLGFLAFAVECFTMWHFTRRFLPAAWLR